MTPADIAVRPPGLAQPGDRKSHLARYGAVHATALGVRPLPALGIGLTFLLAGIARDSSADRG